ncbi:MAG: hypothetical protein AAGM22_19045 [Acidobacteriota bacterium]
MFRCWTAPLLSTAVLLALTCAGASPAPAADACAALTPDQVAQLFGVEPSTVTEAAGEAGRFGENKSDCKWSFSHGGIQSDLVIFVRERTPKMRGDDPLGAAVRAFIERGEEVSSSKRLPYRAFELEGTPTAALSDDFAFNRYSTMRSLAFTEGDRRFWKLTLSHHLAEPGAELPAIPPEPLVAAAVATGR